MDAHALRRLASYDPGTGLFFAKVRRGSASVGKQLGCIKKGYVVIKFARKAFFAHRLAWLYTFGDWPQHQIDHINGVRTDNRIVNLRDVPAAFNCQNLRFIRPRSRAEKGLLGTTLHKCGRWQAQLRVGDESHYLGLFASEREAHEAYVSAKRRLHPGAIL